MEGPGLAIQLAIVNAEIVNVVEAFFRARSDIAEISLDGTDPNDLASLHWS